MVKLLDDLNTAFGNSKVGKFFKVSERNTTLTRELRAGTSTFLTVCYILAVNAIILADSGGACKASDCDTPSPFCMFNFDPGYGACKERTRRSLVAATAVSALCANFVMGLLSNMPIAVAPGMGMNAYFTYTVVGYHGGARLTYEDALAAIFIEGIIFLILALSGLRAKIFSLVPQQLMFALAGGIGMFLAFIGLQTAEGIGLIAYQPATLVTLGGCPMKDRAYMYILKDGGFDPSIGPTFTNVGNGGPICKTDASGVLQGMDPYPASPNYACLGNQMASASMWLGIFGGLLIVLLMARKFRAAVMMGILFVTFISWIPGHEATYLGAESQIPGGAGRREYFLKGVDAPDISATAGKWDFKAFGRADLWAALMTFLYIDFLDGTGTLYSMVSMLDKEAPGMMDEVKRSFRGMTGALCSDAIGTIIGACVGSSPLTSYIESAVGIKDGGRTGIVSLMVGFWFFLSLFFVPIISSVPPFATGPALIFVGAVMMSNLVRIDWDDYKISVPAFLTIAVTPLSFSIAYGIIAGLASYLFIWMALFVIDVVSMPLTKRPFSDIWAEHKPEVFKPEAPADAPKTIA